jgi:hypothetical protein
MGNPFSQGAGWPVTRGNRIGQRGQADLHRQRGCRDAVRFTLDRSAPIWG